MGDVVHAHGDPGKTLCGLSVTGKHIDLTLHKVTCESCRDELAAIEFENETN